MSCHPSVLLLLIAGVCSGISCADADKGEAALASAVMRVQAKDCTPVLGRLAAEDSSWMTAWFGKPAWSADAPEVLGDTRPAIYASTPSRFSVSVDAALEPRILTTAVRRAESTALADSQGIIRSEVFWDQAGHLTSLGFVELPADVEQWLELQVDVPATAGVLVFSSRLATPGMAQRDATQIAWQAPVLAPQLRPAQPDVILLVIDTLRFDAVEHMPYLSSLMAEGVVWEEAYVPSNWTLPSMASLMTGLSPSEHGCGRGPFLSAHATGEIENRDFRSLNDVPTLAEAMSRAGYATMATHQNPFMEAWTGLHRGFERYVRTADRADANQSTALAWWSAQQHRNRFLMLHFMTPHLPNGAVSALDALQVEDFLAVDQSAAERLSFFDLTLPQQTEVRHAYQSATQQLDSEIKNVVEDLRRSSPDCHILIYADHGEEHWDAGGFEHGFQFDDSVIHVPLAYIADAQPGRVAGKVPAHHLGTYLLHQLGIPNQLPASALSGVQNADHTVKSTYPLYRASIGGRLWDPTQKKWVDLPFTGEGSPGQDAYLDAWSAARLAELGYAGNSTKPLVK